MKPLPWALVGLLLATGCAAPAPPSASAPSLIDTAWVVTTIETTATLPAHLPTIAFTADRYSGSTGCNSFSGELSTSGTTLTLQPPAVTQMACTEPGVTDQESRLLAALPHVSSLTSTPTGLDLLGSDGRRLLTLAKASAEESPRPLLGTRWTLTGLRSATTSTSVVSGSTVSLVLSESSYSGTACNRFGGTLTLSGTQITLHPPHSTKMACTDSALTAQEAAVLSAVVKVTSWKVSGSHLALSAPDGSGLDFVAS